ncbi:MAG: helix-turn-helix domain-containing protein [Clostridiales bacterium]|nr:helix-turn-helix domain-containing protein [Clostridiales bacterium]
MAKQPERNEDRYDATFPTKLRELLEKGSKDGHSTTYKALGEAVGVRQQTISQYANGQTQPTADVVLRIANYFGVSVDYLLTGVSSYNKEYSETLGLSDNSIEHLKRAKEIYAPVAPDRFQTAPYLDELLSDKDFYEFLYEIFYYTEGLKGTQVMTDEMKKQFRGIDLEGYLMWQLQIFVQEFIRKEITKLGLNIETSVSDIKEM